MQTVSGETEEMKITKSLETYVDEMLNFDFTREIKTENINQIDKWGIQSQTLPEWLMFLTEEVGELAEAIAEFMYRDGKPEHLFTEAIQTATLALKIAEFFFDMTRDDHE